MVEEESMAAIFVVLLLVNMCGVVACRELAKSRGSRHVVFWTTMGVVFGPLPIPFLFLFNPVRTPSTVA